MPNIQIVGIRNGYFNNDAEVVNQINTSGAEVLVVGMGVPLQELFIYRNKDKFTHLKLAIAGGAILDFISGNVSRAPLWVRKLNMEWIYRLLLEPRRLWKRYVIGNVVFFYHIFILLLRSKKKG